MQTLDNILDKLDNSREQLLMAIEMLPDEALTEEKAVGRLSMISILAIQAAWEAELVTGLMRIDQGKKPERLLQALDDPQTSSKQYAVENKDRSVDSIFNDYQQVRIQVEQWLGEFSEKALNDPKRFKFFGGKPLVQIVGEVTWEREGKFVSPFSAFAQLWIDSRDAATLMAASTFVPLSNPITEDKPNDNPSN